MSQNPVLLPAPVGKALSLLPAWPGSALFAAVLDRVLHRHLHVDVLERLDTKALRLRVTDARLIFDFTCGPAGFKPARHTEADLTIAASAHDFLLLAQRKEDPDTLFFSRRLIMEGDTELGLTVKNALDALDASVFELGRFARVVKLPHPRELFSRAGDRGL